MRPAVLVGVAEDVAHVEVPARPHRHAREQVVEAFEERGAGAFPVAPVEVRVDGEEDGEGERAERGVDEERKHEPAGYARRPRGVNPDSNPRAEPAGKGATSRSA